MDQPTRPHLPSARPIALDPQPLVEEKVIAHAPLVLFEITVWVRSSCGSCTVRKEAPVSEPTNITVSVDSCSQKPRP